VACVTPWNYPLMQAICKVAPALAAGCPVVLKPSPLASLTCLELGTMALEAGFPEGALSVLTGGPPAGVSDGASRLMSHPQVDFLSFTGSTRGGREMLNASAPLTRRTGLELGGKGAMIVFEDADIVAAVDWAMIGIFVCSGQVCSATSRLLVHSSIAADFTEALLAKTAAVVTGDPLDERTQHGAVISAYAKARILEAVAVGISDGATLACGGRVAEVADELFGGFYVEPTILTDVPPTSALWREEVFGPVLSIATFETEAEAVARTNDTSYGLANAVMSADAERCERVSASLEAGTVWINCNQALFPQTPFGGWKASGFGKEWGEAGMHEYIRTKTVTSVRAGHSWAYYG